jgi:putative Holliday junction resolvase
LPLLLFEGVVFLLVKSVNRYLSIDFGEKRVGIAISDPSRIIAQPLKTIDYVSKKKLLQEIDNLLKEFDISKIILGLPLTLKGTDSAKTTEVRQFEAQLKQMTQIPVVLFDERLTSLEARQILTLMGKKPSFHKEKIDQLAAQRILQTYLDRENYAGKSK